ncbi:hypothetical protein LXM25_17185 [Dyadobacter sp. LJ53]|uniref:hypothetical protein n=1 Tax=Dyadobacter chenwenxiniae TaxID=2906456 RepID=UPI001F3A90FA|nr:hypothetical protein [Dyadobacter chenwenxiniae]MCF0051804.1 hypothetical protein [Dyadobacter chenwenxiniae]
MHAPNLKQRTAPSAMLLAKMEEIIQAIGTTGKTMPYPFNRRLDISFFVNFIQENKVILSGEGMTANVQRLSKDSFHLDDSARNRFVSILRRMAKAHEGISRQERLFVHRFWSEIQKSS